MSGPDHALGREASPARRAAKEYTEPYPVERNHQGLDSRPIEERQRVLDLNGAVERRERLGGVFNDYDRRAA